MDDYINRISIKRQSIILLNQSLNPRVLISQFLQIRFNLILNKIFAHHFLLSSTISLHPKCQQIANPDQSLLFLYIASLRDLVVFLSIR
jgi:hypothetical protein